MVNRWESSDSEDDTSSSQRPQKKQRVQLESGTPMSVSSVPNPKLSLFLSASSRSVDLYERLNKIDEGSYGIVWRAREKSTNEIVALKQVKFPSDITKEGFPLAPFREINVLRSLSHPNILNVKEMVVGGDASKCFMVMECMEMDLRDAVDNLTEPLTQGELKHVIRQVLSAMEHMHSRFFFHRDMKTSNILVHKSGKISVCDFGLARTFDDPRRNSYTPLVITLAYRPPELLMGTNTYGPEVDMWSVGCIFAELILREQLFVGNGELDQLSKIFGCLGAPSENNWEGFSKLKHAGALRWNGPKVSKLGKLFPANAFSGKTFLDQAGFVLLEKMLTMDPKKRISAIEAVDDCYFTSAPLPTEVRWNI